MGLVFKLELDALNETEFRLARTRLERVPDSGGPGRESQLVAAMRNSLYDPDQSAKGLEEEFQWRSPVKALTVFFLKWMEGGQAESFVFKEQEHPLARSLAEVLRRPRKAEQMKNWIRKMFLGQREAASAIGSFFIFKYCPRKEQPLCWVRPGSPLKAAKIQIRLRLQNIEAKARFAELALKLEKQAIGDRAQVMGQLEAVGPDSGSGGENHEREAVRRRQEEAQPRIPLPQAPSKILDGQIELLVYDRSVSRFVPAIDFGLPLHTGTDLMIQIRLNRPACICVVWITSEGRAQPLYPWEKFQRTPSTLTEPADCLILPDQPRHGMPRGFSLNTGAGTETVVLLARAAPLPPHLGSVLPKVFQARLVEFAKFRMPNPNELYRFSSLDTDVPAPSPVRLGQPRPVEDPRLRFKLALCESLGIHFDLIKGVSFANAGTDKTSREQAAAGGPARSAR